LLVARYVPIVAACCANGGIGVWILRLAFDGLLRHRLSQGAMPDAADAAHAASADHRPDETDRREVLCEMLRLFYGKGWVSGTGGGICATAGPGELLLAPTGVHKERVRPDDLFVMSLADGSVLAPPTSHALKPSECAPIFRAIVNARGAGSVVHSHALAAVLAADLAIVDHLVIERLEMLKGLPGVSNADQHLVPVIANTEREPELTGEVDRVLAEATYGSARAILVRDHGAYIWGDDVWEAKKHAEVYHFLFDATVARATAARATAARAQRRN
jgi:methylthioribulose-1-phosphate dehydratase